MQLLKNVTLVNSRSVNRLKFICYIIIIKIDGSTCKLEILNQWNVDLQTWETDCRWVKGVED